MQTGKTAIRPVVLLDPPDGAYWRQWQVFVRDHLVGRGLASPEDLSLFEQANSIEEAVTAIERFYRNYDSVRYVGERLIVRMKRAPDAQQLQWLNAEFADLLAAGEIERAGITPAEARDGDCLGMERIALYPRPDFGRLRQLIDALNALD
jgi:hypothetical protein